MPDEGTVPFYVNSTVQQKFKTRHKRDLTSINKASTQNIPDRPGLDACYQDSRVDTQDLADTRDAQITDEIKALAKKLDHSPLAIFNYVANHIEYELYQGSVKGAAGTLLSLAGNDTDQASLLIALLRASGYPARYVRGTAEFNPLENRHTSWVKAKDLENASRLLANAKKKVTKLLLEGELLALYFDHVWVEACVPYANYRGSRQDDSGYQWLPLDASYKLHQLTRGIQHSVKFDYDAFLKQRSDLLAHEFYQEQIEASIRAKHPDATIAQVGDHWTRKQRQYTHLPETLPFRVVQYSRWSDEIEASSVAALPASHRKQLWVEINGQQTTTLDFIDSTQKRVTLSFEGLDSEDKRRYRQWQQGKASLTCPTNLLLKPVVRLDGVTLPSQGTTTISLCQGDEFRKLKIRVGFKQDESVDNSETRVFNNISPLDHHAIQAYGFQSSDAYLEKRARRLTKAINAIDNPWDQPDETVGEYLDVVLLKYMRYISDGIAHIGALDGNHSFAGHHIGITSTLSKVEYLFDLPLAINATNLLVDVPGALVIMSSPKREASLNDTFKLAGFLASQYESYIWQENAERDAVSTVSGLQIAHQDGIPVQTFTANSELSKWLIACQSKQKISNCYPQNTVRALTAELKSAGGELTIPQYPLDYDGWMGLIYMHVSDVGESGRQASFSINRYNGGYALNTRINNVEKETKTLDHYFSGQSDRRERIEQQREEQTQRRLAREEAEEIRRRNREDAQWERELKRRERARAKQRKREESRYREPQLYSLEETKQPAPVRKEFVTKQSPQVTENRSVTGWHRIFVDQPRSTQKQRPTERKEFVSKLDKKKNNSGSISRWVGKFVTPKNNQKKNEKRLREEAEEAARRNREEAEEAARRNREDAEWELELKRREQAYKEQERRKEEQRLAELKRQRQAEAKELERLSYQNKLYKQQQAKQSKAPSYTPAKKAPAITAATSKPEIAPHTVNSLKTKGVSNDQNDGGDPVNLITGNMYHMETDFNYPARGLPIVFARTYNSLGIEDGPLGYGWTHSFNHRLRFQDGNSADQKTSEVVWIDGTGAERTIRLFSESISRSGVGTLTDKNIMVPPGLYFKFKQMADGYEIIEKNGLVYRFSQVPGKVGDIARLIAMRDTLGNALNFTYKNGQLVALEDSDQRKIHFNYDNSGYLTEIRNWANQTYRYEYDKAHNLVAVWTPDNDDRKDQSSAASHYRYYSDIDGPTLNHRMQSFRYANGYQMTFEYYPNGKTARHYNAKGESMVFKYNTFRRETQTINERGHTERFFFNAGGSLVKKIDLEGNKHLHEFKDPLDPFLRTAYINPLGHRVEYQYDALGNLVSEILPSGDAIAYLAYNDFGRYRLLKNANGDHTALVYSPEGLLLERVHFKQGKTAAFDLENPTAADIAAQAEDIIAWTRYQYSTFGNLIKRQTVKKFTDPESGPYVHYSYRDTENSVNGLYPTQVAYYGDFDGDGVVGKEEGYGPYPLEYDELGRQSKGQDAARYPLEYQYSPGGRLLSSQDHRGVKTDYQYDLSGLLMSVGQSAFEDGEHRTFSASTFKYDRANRLVTQGDRSGAMKHYRHDPMGNVIEFTDPDGYRTQRSYNKAHQVVEVKTADNRVTRYRYDALGRPVEVILPGGNRQSFAYYGAENNGWLREKISPNIPGYQPHTLIHEYDKNGRVIRVTDQLDRSTLTDYDSLGRVIRMVSPAYEDKVLGKVRPVKRYIYNELGFLTQIQAGYTNTEGDRFADQVSIQARYGYDDLGRRRSETDALNRTWTYDYDEHNRLIAIKSPMGESLVYEYDRNGWLSRRKLLGNDTTTLTSYQHNVFGLLTKIMNEATGYAYRYDKANRLSGVRNLRTEQAIFYDYSLGGLLNKVSDFEGHEVYYQYDPVGQLTGLQSKLLRMSLAYDDAGRLIHKQSPTNITKYLYYPEGSIKYIMLYSSSDGVPIEQHAYSYDEAGLVKFHLQGHGAGLQNQRRRLFEYDSLNRLTRVFDDDRTYELIDYDPFGNWRQRTTTFKQAGAASTENPSYQEETEFFAHNALHQLTEVRQANADGEPGAIISEYDYDFNGRLIRRQDERGLLQLSYDALDRLIQAQNSQLKDPVPTGLSAGPPAPKVGLVERYQYDPLGRRIQKTTNDRTLVYWYEGDRIWKEYERDSDTLLLRALYFHGAGIDQPLARITNSGGLYYHTDRLGSVSSVTGADGMSVSYQRYSAWGTAEEAFGEPIPTYGYTGRELDATGLLYYRNRYYDPQIGRFIQQDPLGFIDGVNRYAYVMNNPINFVDPWGTMATGPTKVARSIGTILMPNTFAEKRPGTWSDHLVGSGKALYNEAKSAASLLIPSIQQTPIPPEQRYGAMGTEWLLIAGSLPAKVLGSAGKIGKVAKGTKPPNLSPSGAGRKGAFREAKRQSGVPVSQQPSRVTQNLDKRGKPQLGKNYEFDIVGDGGKRRTINIRDDAGGHDFGPGNSQNRGPHFNDEAGNHFDY